MSHPNSFIDDKHLPDKVQNGILITCVVLQLVGFVGCLLILLTAIFSTTVNRHATWYSFILTWVASSISYLLLLVSGNLENKTPAFGVCIAQAALIYSVPILTATSTLALVTQVYFNIRNLFSAGVRRNDTIWTLGLLVVPYLLLIIMLVLCLVIGLHDPATVHRADLQTPYCNMINRIPSKISSISVASTMVPTIILEIVICITLRKNWAVLRTRTYSLSTAIRIIGFSVFGMIAIAVSVAFASSQKRDPEMNIIISAMPAAAAILFGTQDDIVKAWMFWRKPEASTSKEATTSNTELQRRFVESIDRVPSNTDIESDHPL